ncbi:hypothetical protein [Tropicimonas sp. S265A]|uniref:hypothetical protein n=1 Tax=Tropicimonas sp. S265A TaxID=3415134 RepID=UPI003C7DF61C
MTLLRILACLLWLLPSLAAAQTAERNLTVEIDATVAAIDADTREITLRDPENGATQVIVAGPEVRNFDQIAVGDTVRAVYSLGLVARMAQPGENDSVAALEGSAVEGEKPGAVDVVAVTRVLELVSYDAETFVATLRDSDGHLRSAVVETEDGRAFAANLSPGDKVALTFSESMAIGIVRQ